MSQKCMHSLPCLHYFAFQTHCPSTTSTHIEDIAKGGTAEGPLPEQNRDFHIHHLMPNLQDEGPKRG